MNAVDTNLLLYAHDPRDERKRAAAGELISTLEDGVLLWQVACEYIAASRKLGPFGFNSAAAFTVLDKLRAAWSLALPTWNVHVRAEALIASHSLSWWDALLIAASLEAGITRLYTEDLSPDMKFESIKIVNPFK